MFEYDYNEKEMNLIEETWLLYFNNYLFDKGLLSEEESRQMEEHIRSEYRKREFK